MSLFFSKIKIYLWVALGFMVTGLMIAVRVLSGRNSRLSRELETKDAKIHHAKVVEEKKKNNETEYRSRTTELAKDLEERKASSELSNPNDEW